MIEGSDIIESQTPGPTTQGRLWVCPMSEADMGSATNRGERARRARPKPIIVSDFGDVNGGAAQVAILEARGLAERGVNVTFVCALEPLSPLLEHPRIDVQCLRLGDVWKERNPLRAVRNGIWSPHAR